MKAIALGWVLLVVGCGRTELEAQPNESCERKTISKQVPSTAPWFDTGIDLDAGDRLEIIASGMVRYGTPPEKVTDADGGTYTGDKFIKAAVLPNTVIVSLIGKVGGSTAMDTGTPLPEGLPDNGPGFVGTDYDEIVSTSGRLFLGFNDRKKTFDDNSGSFAVNISLCL